MLLKFFQRSLCYRLSKIKLEVAHDNDKSLESGEPKEDLSNEKKVSRGRVITVQDAVWHPKTDQSKEKISKGYAGTAQDIKWRILKEPDDCGRKDVYWWNRIKGEYEN